MGHSEHEWIGASWKQNTGGGFSRGGVLIIPGKDQNEGQLGWFWMAHGFAWRESLFSHSLITGGFLLSSGDPLSYSVCGLGECNCRCMLSLGHDTQTQNCMRCPEISVQIPDLLSPTGRAELWGDPRAAQCMSDPLLFRGNHSPQESNTASKLHSTATLCHISLPTRQQDNLDMRVRRALDWLFPAPLPVLLLSLGITALLPGEQATSTFLTLLILRSL